MYPILADDLADLPEVTRQAARALRVCDDAIIAAVDTTR
jgi:hypothetical protein